jgi:hypothetical protein
MVSLRSHTLLSMSRAWIRRVTLVVSAGIVAVGTTACTGSSSSGTSTAPQQRASATPTCPSVAASPAASSAKATRALRNVPFGLPMPDGVTFLDSSVTAEGIRVVKFSTPTSLRQAVLFIVERYPKAGYVIGRGDAEATEADAPWIHTGVHGLTRVAVAQPCQTLWLLASVPATGTAGTSPLLSPHPTSSVTSALPFG